MRGFVEQMASCFGLFGGNRDRAIHGNAPPQSYRFYDLLRLRTDVAFRSTIRDDQRRNTGAGCTYSPRKQRRREDADERESGKDG
jgi:hypothetical protein